ncbi:lipocalin family protein [Aquimarina hainanensis]|uniref:Lipocalin family protein n=1 Tax=Aquimarina hainanensis TaxID=1578017 RepID=A0ABW5N2W5_9FLAO|nr:lipocalin family protein [Aquimarina sp. TRL1]QKX05980.1 lipocalin family protein [Aquimarina sp. TRL1]
MTFKSILPTSVQYLFAIFLLVFSSCSRKNPEDLIPFINGYWEIERVRLHDGSLKEYGFNPIVDHFTIEGLKGMRTKLKPRLDGTFVRTNPGEPIELKIENDSLFIYYQKANSPYKETVISAKENEIVLKNAIGNTYFYKPYKKIVIQP